MKIQNIKNKILEFWFGENELNRIRLAAFRVCVSVSLAAYVWAWGRYGREWLTTDGFHISAWNLPYHPLWVPAMPPFLLPLFGVILFLGIAALIFGYFVRPVLWLVLVCVVYVTLVDQTSAFTLNKLLIVSFAVLASGSDPGLSRRQTAWPVRILQITLVAHYFLSGWSKAHWGDWLVSPNLLWTQMQGYYRTDAAGWLLEHVPVAVWTAVQWSVIVFELGAPVLFTVKRLRPYALVFGVIFHVMIGLLMHHFIYFSLVTLSFYVLFFKEFRKFGDTRRNPN
jgi:uncharacterized membrane protein YphA (DoxX/SURF4 family)